jgi:hypothetical protein
MIDYAVLGRKVLKTYPFLAKELITIPDIDDLSMIDQLHIEYCDIQATPLSKSKSTYQRLVFIATILKLYDPDSFEFKKNMKNGLRKQLSITLQCKPTIISDSFKTVRNYLSIYPDFTNEVAYIYSKLKMYADGNCKGREELPNS